MDEREDAIRATADDLIADAETLQAIEGKKATMHPDDPRIVDLADDAVALVKEMNSKATLQREIVAET
jgi:hypothetical protein